MSYLPSEEGQGLVEYSLILTLLSLAVMAALVLLGPAVSDEMAALMSITSGAFGTAASEHSWSPVVVVCLRRCYCRCPACSCRRPA